MSKVFMTPSSKTNITPKKGTQPGWINMEQDLEANWWDLRIGRLKRLAQIEGNSEVFDSLYDTLLKEKPNSFEIQKTLLHRLDDSNRKENLDSILPLLDQLLLKIDEGAIRKYFSSRKTGKSKQEQKEKANMEEKKAELLDLLYRKARALAYQETLLKKQTAAFDETLAELRSWVDTNDDKLSITGHS
jgi:tripeptidyl-peptidase-2